MDAAGPDAAALRASGAGAALLTPAHQLRTGVVLDGERRRDLLGRAAAGGPVIEDDQDAEHRYDRAPVPALCPAARGGLLRRERVRAPAPALRLGRPLAPPRLCHVRRRHRRRRDATLGALAEPLPDPRLRGGLDRRDRGGHRHLATASAGVAALPETGRKVFPERRQPPGGSRVVRG
ncbi:hypothetical protein [Streptomyces sp. NRRL S-237]|uniref:hypothetical protein n=1 Tax=Streptomyces sp. NRRL S-237 TaxID=1463895 RepID=UPI000AF2C4B3|nr:hypothetical protein [Streptomyces sp. NRRL S-237]